MTIIAAVKDTEGSVWIASDNFYGSTYHNMSCHSVDTNKIVEFDNFKLLIAGLSTVRDAAEMLAEDRTDYSMDSKSDARHFATLLFKQIKDNMEAGGGGDKIKSAAFIIATETKIFKVWQDLACFEMNYISDGAGCDYFLGAWEAITNINTPTSNNTEALLKIAMRAVAKLSPMCNDDIRVLKVKLK